MKKLFLSTVALIGLVGAAAAADLPARAAPPAYAPVPAFTWTGFYFGVHAGYLWSDTDVKLTGVGGDVLPYDVEFETLPRSISVEQDGVLGGVQSGYNMQFGMFVAGVEADFSWTDADGEKVYSAPDRYLLAARGDITNTVAKSELEWLATFRGRLGLSVDRALFFVTGGAAAGEVTNKVSINIPTAPAPLGPYYSPLWGKQDTEWGWTVGGGIEYALFNNMSVKAEYLYYDLGDRTVHGTDSSLPRPPFGQEWIGYKFKNNGNIARAGLNFRF